MIAQRNISLIANQLAAAGGRRIPEAVIERDYVLAWFLTGLAGHPLREQLAFKGGTALRRCWFEHYRFSEDLDFTLTKAVSLDEILAGRAQAIAAKEERLKRLWTARLAHQMNDLPPFDAVFGKVLRTLRAAKFPDARH